MFWAIKQLANPLVYLRVRQGESLFYSKRVYDWIIPAMLAVLMIALAQAFAPRGPIFSEQGIVGGFQKLLEVLIPFYIAALAAVATFERKGLDEYMKGHPALLRVMRSDGQKSDEILTRRQFICYLFGYLSFLSLLLFVAILLGRIIGTKVGYDLNILLGDYKIYGKVAVLFLFLFPIWQMIVTTILGVYFLSERLQVMKNSGR